MQDGALDNALKTEGGLRIDIVFTVDRRRVLNDELGQILAKLFYVSATGAQGLGG